LKINWGGRHEMFMALPIDVHVAIQQLLKQSRGFMMEHLFPLSITQPVQD
jgi:hypothetical protein